MKSRGEIIKGHIEVLESFIKTIEKNATPRQPLRRIRNALAAAVWSLEKQQPKRVLKLWNRTKGDVTWYRYTCPSCEIPFFTQEEGAILGEKAIYCKRCGQRLEWVFESEAQNE